MTACAWPLGCVVTQLLDADGLCSYHAKVAAGLIESTRAEGKDIVPVPMTELQRKRAERAKADRFEAEMARQEERRQRRREAMERRYAEALARS